MQYQYWVIRYLPDVARGEFVNIGIVCGADGIDWAVRFDDQSIRLRGALGRDYRDLSAWRTWFADRVGRYADRRLDDDEVSVGWLEHVRRRQASSVQFSEAMPVVAASAESALDLLFPIIIGRAEPKHADMTRNRASIRHDVSEALQRERHFELRRNLFLSPKLHVGRQRGNFDLGRDDVRGTVVTNTWGFNIQSLDELERDTQSWNYLVSRFRDDGAEVHFGPAVRLLAGDERVEVVYDPPTLDDSDGRRWDLFEATREAWTLNEVSAVAYGEYFERLREAAPLAVRA